MVSLDHLGDLVVELLEVKVAFVGHGYAIADDVDGPVEGILVADSVEAISQIHSRIVDALDDFAMH